MRRRANRLMGGGRTVLWDSFTDTDGVTVLNHTPSGGFSYSRPDSVGYTGRGVIDTNRCRPEQTSSNETLFIKSRLRRRNVRVSADIIRTALGNSSQIGVIVRAKENANGGTIRWGHQALHLSSSNAWQLTRLSGGQIGSNVSQILTIDQVYRLEVEVRGPVFILRVDGSIILQGEDVFTVKDGLGLRFVGFTTTQVLRLDNWMVSR